MSVSGLPRHRVSAEWLHESGLFPSIPPRGAADSLAQAQMFSPKQKEPNHTQQQQQHHTQQTPHTQTQTHYHQQPSQQPYPLTQYAAQPTHTPVQHHSHDPHELESHYQPPQQSHYPLQHPQPTPQQQHQHQSHFTRTQRSHTVTIESKVVHPHTDWDENSQQQQQLPQEQYADQTIDGSDLTATTPHIDHTPIDFHGPSSSDLSRTQPRFDSSSADRAAWADLERARSAHAARASEDERALFAKYRKMETSLAGAYEEKMNELEQVRQQAMRESAERQRQIDAGNQIKLKQIVATYKARIQELEQQLQESFEAKLRASDQLILQQADATRRREEYDGIVAGYKVLVDEQASEIGMLRQSNASLTSDLASVKVTYEELIATLGEAQSIKIKHAQESGAQNSIFAVQAHQRVAELEASLQEARVARDRALQESASLRLAHDRVIGSLEIAGQSKAFAEQELDRAHSEHARTRQELHRLEKIVYGGHKNPNSSTHASSSSTGGAQPVTKKTVTTRRTITLTAAPGTTLPNGIQIPPMRTPGDAANNTLTQAATNANAAHLHTHHNSQPHLSRSPSPSPTAFFQASSSSLHGHDEPLVNFSAALAQGTRDQAGVPTITTTQR